MTPAVAAQRLLAARESAAAVRLVLEVAMGHPELVERMTDDEKREMSGWAASTFLEAAEAIGPAREALHQEANQTEESV